MSGTFPLAEATDVYERLGNGDLRGVGFLFKYDETTDVLTCPVGATSRRRSWPRQSSIRSPSAAGHSPPESTVRVGFVGAGNYASSMLLPHIAGRPGVELARVATRRSLSAVNAQRKFSFTEAGTSTESLLHDESIDVVLHRYPSQFPRRTCLPGARSGQDRVRRKAPGPVARAARPDRGDDRRDRERPADGRLQPSFCTHDAGDAQAFRANFGANPRSLLCQCRHPLSERAGTATKNSKGPASSAKAVTSWTL